MALPMTMIVLTGEIDLSVASMLGLGASVFGYAFAHHTGVVGAMAIALAVGALGGSLNGFLVAQLGLPSIAVTIGTLTMFRGIAEVVLGQNEVTGFPTSLTNIGIEPDLPAHRLPVLLLRGAGGDLRGGRPQDGVRSFAVRDRPEHGGGVLLRDPRQADEVHALRRSREWSAPPPGSSTRFSPPRRSTPPAPVSS